MNRGHNQRGFLLIAVLVIVMLASMVALSLLFRMRAEQASFAASAGSEQAWYAALSGIQQAMHLAQVGRHDPALWHNNPAAFRQQLVLDDGSDRWYFTIYNPPLPEEQQVRYGLSDENSRLNLNKASAEMLLKVTHLAPALVQEIAPDARTSTNALTVEDLMFDAIPRPVFSTIDELLKLNGATPGAIYGEDANRNFRLDPNEDDGIVSFPPDDSDGQLFLGLQEVATVYSYEYDVANDGSPRLQLNTPRESVPDFILPDQATAFLQAAWKAKRLFTSPADLLEAREKFRNEQGQEVEVESGVGAQELPVIMDQLTTTFDARLVGLINVNTASAAVLQTIPGLSENKAEEIVAAREGLAGEVRQTTAWLFSEGILTAEEFKKAAPFLTARSLQFRFHVIGYALPSGRFRVFEVVIDTADKEPQITYLRDITRLGLPFPLTAGEDLPNVQTPTQT